MSAIFSKPFDARAVAPSEAFETLPAGWYTAMIVQAEDKENSNKSGRYLELQFEIIGGDFNKRKVFERLNLVHPNDQTQDIAYRDFSAICHASGQLVVSNEQELYAKPMLIKIKVRAARTDTVTGKDYEASNEIKGYKAIDSTKPPVTGPPKSAANGPAAATVGAAPAWANGAAPAASPAQPPPAWAAPAAAAPVAAPVAPPVAAPPVPAAPVAPPAAAFPPEGWTPHPSAPGYFYKGQEVLTEAALRATMAPPIPAAPVVPPVPPAPAPAPAPAAGGAPPWAGAAAAPAAGGTPPWAVKP